MLIKYDGKEYQFDLDEIDVAQATTIKRTLGLTLLGIEKGLREMDVDALRAVYWLMLQQNGEKTDLARVNFKPVKFGMAVGDASKEEADAQAETEGPKDE